MLPVRFKLNVTEKLNFKAIPNWVFEVVRELIRNNYQVYLVGGAVRDLLWDKQPGDWDLASDALPEQVAAIFPDTISTGEKFGTMIVLYDGNAIEVTTLREDLGYSDGRHPENIRFGRDICMDLARRDFTINALAYDFSSQELIDPFGGKKDIQRRLLKAVGDPGQRFHEDGLRMFRFYRFLATLELRAHRPTEQAINPDWAAGVSYERIREEFSKLLLGREVGRGLNALKNSGLLRCFIPEFDDGIRQVKDTADQVRRSNDLWKHSLKATVEIKPQLQLRLAALLHDVAKPLTRTHDETGVHFYGHDELGAGLARTILVRLHYPNKLIDKVAMLIRSHMFFVSTQTGDGAIRRLIARVGPENILDLLELRRADIIATGEVDYHSWEIWRDLSERITNILNGKTEINPFRLAIKGSDLIESLQLSPGPLIGEILAYLHESILDEPAFNQKPVLLKLAQDYIQAKDKS
jgi:tRNA nucleotidyltransferase (CCA-adding enzyme)